MERYAVIEGGTVENIAVADAEFASAQGWIACADDVAPGWTYDGEAFAAPVVPLDDLKAALWTEAKALRDAAIDAGVDVAGIGRFDSDPASRGNINGAVTMALVAASTGQPFEISWRLADNSVTTLSGAQMIAVGVAVGQHVAACHAAAQAIGIAIQAAADRSALATIDIGAGWP